MVKTAIFDRENLDVNEDGHLCMRGHDLVDLADRFGTPLYVIDAQRIRENFRRFKNAFESYPELLIAYAYKANPTLAVCSILKEEGAGAEVVSGGELYIALTVGVNPSDIVFDGVSKNENELKMAIENEIWAVNVESLQELRRIDEIALKSGIKARIGVRINPDVPTKTHPYDVTGMRSSKFGLDPKSAIEAYKLAMKMENIEIAGIHVHIGSQITETKSFRMAAIRLFDFISKLNDMGIVLDYIDLGGGLGITYRGPKEDYLRDYAKTLLEVINQRIRELRLDEPRLVLEPGRYLVADSSLLLTRVNYTKHIFGSNWALVDAGMNDFMRPALYDAYHEIVAVNKAIKPKNRRYNVGGPVCESSDIFGYGVELPEISQGDLLAILDVGAYGICMSNQYNARPRPAMVLLDGTRIAVIRERESYEDLVSKDIIPDWMKQ